MIENLPLTAIDDARRANDERRKKRGLTAESMMDFGPTKTTRIQFLDGFSMPATGGIVHGARTGSGKTTMGINFAREYLEQGRTVSFISYEMNAQEVALAIVLSLYAKERAEPIRGWNRNLPGPGERISNLDDLERSLPPLAEDDNPDFVDTFARVKEYISQNGEPPEALKSAYNKLGDFLADDRLRIIDGMGNIDKLAEFIRSTAFDVYLVDYIQIIPTAADYGGTYKETQSVVHVLRELVNKDKKLIIAGAQFNRTMGDESTRDSFDPRPDQFREAADIEQFASIAFGTGYQVDEEGKRHYFYKILKHRYAGRMTNAKIPSAGFFEFYYAQRGGRWTLPEKWPKPARKLGGNQELVVKILRNAGGDMALEDLAKAWEAEGKARQYIKQTIEPLLKSGRIKLVDSGKYHLLD